MNVFCKEQLILKLTTNDILAYGIKIKAKVFINRVLRYVTSYS